MNERTALLVERDPETRDFYRSVLQRDGYRVLEAEDGASALRIARQEKPDLLVRKSPVVLSDGSTLAETLRGDPATASTKVLTITINEGPWGRMRLLSYATDEPRPAQSRAAEETRRSMEALRRMVGGVLLA